MNAPFARSLERSRRTARPGGSRLWARRAVRIAAIVASVVLAAFHVRLFWERVSDQSVFEPLVAAKWIVTALVAAGLWRLRGTGLFKGRRAGVLWLLALLLHVQVPLVPVAASPMAFSPDLDPAEWLWTFPLTIAVALYALLAVFALSLHSSLKPVPERRHRGRSPSRRPLAGVLPALSCRPPPAVS